VNTDPEPQFEYFLSTHSLQPSWPMLLTWKIRQKNIPSGYW